MARIQSTVEKEEGPAALEPWRAPDLSLFVDPFDDLALLGYYEAVAKWHGYARFLGLPHLRENADQPLYELYVEPFLTREPVSPERPPKEWVEKAQPLLAILVEIPRLVVLGDPGSGKSTLVSWIAWQLTQSQPGPWRERLGPLVPLPMILREMELHSSLDADGLLAAFVAHPVAEKLRAAPDLLRTLLDRGQAFLLLDGLDEIGNLEVREALRDGVFALAERYPSCRFLLTSRIVGYEQVPVDFEPRKINIRKRERFHLLESRRYVAPFTDDQVERFAHNWYARREVAEELRKTGARDLVSAIHGSEATLRLARIPNLLTLMALIHRVQRRLPHGRALLFEKIAEAYLESIDAFRGIQEVDYPLAQKKRWLAYVGFQMQRRRSEKGGAALPEVLVDQQTVETWILEAMAGSARGADPRAAGKFLDYIGRRSGLLLPRGEGLFAFTHLSFQEYFAAVYLAEQVTSPRWLSGKAAPEAGPDNLKKYANEVPWGESLMLLFELLADRAEWSDELAQVLFGEDFKKVYEEGEDFRAALAADISVDPYSGLTKENRTTAWKACWRQVITRTHEKFSSPKIIGFSTVVLAALSHSDLSELPGVWRAFEEVLKDLRPVSLSLRNCQGIEMETLSEIGRISELQKLDLGRTSLVNVSPLATLVNLQMLSLSETSIGDVSPLSGLMNLERLYLDETLVSDVSPLAGLVNLQILNLRGTLVSDVSPLSHLEKLKVER